MEQLQSETLIVQLQEGKKLRVEVLPTDTLSAVARQVREAQGWDPQQHMRFISSGQELFAHDSVARAAGGVLHCIACQAPAHRYPAAKAGAGSKGGHSLGVDWLEVVDPGTVLLWIFGSILALLWLLFVCYAHMFDKTSVVMLCMMTVAFLIPCVLSYVPALRVVAQPVGGSGAHRHTSGAARPGSTAAATAPAAAGHTGWQQYSTSSTRGSYTGAIPPRPAAPRARPSAAT